MRDKAHHQPTARLNGRGLPYQKAHWTSTTLPSMMAVLPSSMATRERPSQVDAVSTTKGDWGSNTHWATWGAGCRQVSVMAQSVIDLVQGSNTPSLSHLVAPQVRPSLHLLAPRVAPHVPLDGNELARRVRRPAESDGRVPGPHHAGDVERLQLHREARGRAQAVAVVGLLGEMEGVGCCEGFLKQLEERCLELGVVT